VWSFVVDALRYHELSVPVVAATSLELGCQLYAIAADVCDPKVVWISEQWSGEGELTAHLKTPHIGQFLVDMATVTIVDMDVRKYTVSDIGGVEMPE
jgi:quinol monooxygenase YgiN